TLKPTSEAASGDELQREERRRSLWVCARCRALSCHVGAAASICESENPDPLQSHNGVPFTRPADQGAINFSSSARSSGVKATAGSGAAARSSGRGPSGRPRYRAWRETPQTEQRHEIISYGTSSSSNFLASAPAAVLGYLSARAWRRDLNRSCAFSL